MLLRETHETERRRELPSALRVGDGAEIVDNLESPGSLISKRSVDLSSSDGGHISGVNMGGDQDTCLVAMEISRNNISKGAWSHISSPLAVKKRPTHLPLSRFPPEGQSQSSSSSSSSSSPPSPSPLQYSLNN